MARMKRTKGVREARRREAEARNKEHNSLSLEDRLKKALTYGHEETREALRLKQRIKDRDERKEARAKKQAARKEARKRSNNDHQSKKKR